MLILCLQREFLNNEQIVVNIDNNKEQMTWHIITPILSFRFYLIAQPF